jgi:hypothetical protein
MGTQLEAIQAELTTLGHASALEVPGTVAPRHKPTVFAEMSPLELP